MVEEGDRQTPSLAVRGRPPPPRRTATAIGLGRVPGTRTEVIRLARSQTQPPTDTVAAQSLFALP